MLETILKRDGTSQNFTPYKIEDAIRKAFKSESTPYDNAVYVDVITTLKDRRVAAVEDIQDLIEQVLFKARYFDVMKSFAFFIDSLIEIIFYSL